MLSTFFYIVVMAIMASGILQSQEDWLCLYDASGGLDRIYRRTGMFLQF